MNIRGKTGLKFCGFLCAAATLLCLLPAAASAQEEDLTGCATDTWTAMVNQATLESRRETVMNQTFILKPDSILQYACFETALKAAQDKAGPVFSETDHWEGLTVDISGKSRFNPKSKQVQTQTSLGSNSLDMALTAAVRSAMGEYLKNYDHTMLGGTSGIAATTDDCALMQKVWKAAQCSNFDDPKVFYKFDELIGADNDPRKYPSNMKCDETGIKQEAIDIAQNKDFAHAEFSEVDTHLEYLLSEKGGKCALTIPTGVIVHRMQARKTLDGKKGHIGAIEKFKDAVCPNIGCVYKGSGTTNKKCQ